MDTTSNHYKGKFRNIYAVHAEFPNGGAVGDFVDIGGFAHYWNEDRGTWSVNENRDQYWDEKFAGVDNEIDGLKKADETLRAEIGKKADKAYVDAEIGKKLDKPTDQGTTGQVLSLGANGKPVWKDEKGGGGEGGIPDAPMNGKKYGRLNGIWSHIKELFTVTEDSTGTTTVSNEYVRIENKDGKSFVEVDELGEVNMQAAEGQTQFNMSESGISVNMPNNASFTVNGKPIGSNEELETKVNDLQAEVDELIAGNITYNVLVSPSVIFAGGARPAISIAATASKACDIAIKQGTQVLESVSNVTRLSVPDAINTTTTYTAEFTFKGKTTTKTATVTAVYPIYYGSGAVYTDVTNDSHKYGTATTSPARTYAVNVASNGQKVFFVVPSTMTINKATLNGFDFPLKAAQTQTIGGVSYKVYESENTYNTGTYNIVIS